MIGTGAYSVVSEEVNWTPMSKSDPKVADSVKAGYDAKPLNEIEFNEDSEIGFFTNIFKFAHTAIQEIMPQLIIQAMIVTGVWFVIWYVPDFQLPTELGSAHGALGKILSFLLVFKVGQGYGNYVAGRIQLGGVCNDAREMAQGTFTFQLSDQADMVKVELLRKVIRRKLNVMVAFMRQWARESGEGFVAGSQLEASGQDYVGKGEGANWHLDPCKPAIGNMISKEEFATYNAIPPGMRPAYVQTELNMLAAELSTESAYPEFMHNGFVINSADTMNLFKGIYRIVETPVPYPYLHLLYFLNLIYTWMTPLVYCMQATPELNDKFAWLGGWTASMLICMCFNGLMETSALLHNPFGHDLIDHDIGSFCMKIHGETKVIAGMVKAEVGSDMTDYSQLPQ